MASSHAAHGRAVVDSNHGVGSTGIAPLGGLRRGASRFAFIVLYRTGALGYRMSESRTFTAGSAEEPTEITTFQSGEFLRVDSTEDEVAVVWSTSSRLRDVLKLVTSKSEVDREAIALVASGDLGFVEMDSSAAVDLILRDRGLAVTDAWIPFVGFTLSWTRGSGAQRTEVAMIFGESVTLDTSLIEKTGTGAVKANVRRILARSAIVTVLN
ncbi:hypothetical protein BH11ACT4_BH11ACT4_08080 [soil metagenome]